MARVANRLGWRSVRRPRTIPACRHRSWKANPAGEREGIDRAKVPAARAAAAHWSANPTTSRQRQHPVHCRSALTDADQVLHGRYRQDRRPRGSPGGDACGRRPPGTLVLWRRHSGAGAGGHGGRLSLQYQHPDPGDLPALHARHQLPASDPLFLHLYALQINRALDAMFQRAKPCFDNEFVAILARLRRSRIVCPDETSVRINGKTHWNWVFQNDQVDLCGPKQPRRHVVRT